MEDQDLHARLSVLEALSQHIHEHMDEDAKNLDSINTRLAGIEAKLANGISEAVKTLSKNQQHLLNTQAQHATNIKTILWAGGVVITGLISLAVKVVV